MIPWKLLRAAAGHSFLLLLRGDFNELQFASFMLLFRISADRETKKEEFSKADTMSSAPSDSQAADAFEFRGL